jgi:outer membrane lipoprotein-sorting protein
MRKIYLTIIGVIILTALFAEYPDGNVILGRIDANMNARTTKSTTTMIVQTRRATRTMESINWSQGSEKSFSEYTAPARERGTKMLKDGDNLWIFDPSTDRTIQISGNMLKQSVMGSDLSYEDFMEETSLRDNYSAVVKGELVHEGRDTWIMELTAKKSTTSYQKIVLYVDKERYVPLYEERYAKGGKLLKTTRVQEVMQSGNRWYPQKILYKDELKDGKGTLFIINKIEFDVKIPAHIFSKASLKK